MLVVFDLDGTLIDSTRALLESRSLTTLGSSFLETYPLKEIWLTSAISLVAALPRVLEDADTFEPPIQYFFISPLQD